MVMWSLLARPIARPAVLARTLRPAAFALVARRTLFATPQLASATVAKKAGAKKDTKPKKPKKAAKTKTKTKEVSKPQRKRVPKELQPPKRAPSPYVLFYTTFLKSQRDVNSLQDVQQLAKRASEIWKGYTMREKQPYYDESEVRKAQSKQARDEFFSKTSQTDLKQLNAIRKAQGKNKVHSTLKQTVALSPFLAFSSEFRNSPDGQAVISDESIEKRYMIRAAVAAGRRWRSMSADEKAPYLEAYQKEKEQLKAEKAQS